MPALQDALNTLVEDPALRARLGERGRARVMTDFTIERMVGQTTALYRSLIGEALEPAANNLQVGIRN